MYFWIFQKQNREERGQNRLGGVLVVCGECYNIGLIDRPVVFILSLQGSCLSLALSILLSSLAHLSSSFSCVFPVLLRLSS